MSGLSSGSVETIVILQRAMRQIDCSSAGYGYDQSLTRSALFVRYRVRPIAAMYDGVASS